MGTRTTLNGLVALLAGLLGRRLDVEHRPTRTGDVRHSQADGTSLRRLFPGVAGVPLEEGLSRTISWMETTMLADSQRSSP
jgi:UDP-glucose 4-epimerase